MNDSENLFKRLIESVADYVYAVHLENGRPVSTTHGTGCASVTGFTSEEYASDPLLWYRMIHVEDREAVVAQAKTALSGAAAQPLEHRIIHKDGSIRWVRNTTVPRYDREGRLTAYDGTISDITERKQAEEALRRSNEFSQVILNSMHDAVSIVDANTYRICKVNSTFLNIFGLNEDEVIGKTCHEITHRRPRPCSSSGDRCPLVQTRTTGAHAAVEHSHCRKNGELLPVEEFTSPIKNEKGEVTRVIQVSRDISTRKAEQEALRESEERFHRLFEQNVDALFLLKAVTGVIMDVNPAGERLFGYTRGEFIGRDASLFLDRETREKYEQALSCVGSTGNFHVAHLAARKKDGSRAAVSAWGYVVRLPESVVVACSFRDITEKIRLEEEARLFQAKLIQANKMTSLGTLVSGVAHEINSPNNYIAFNVQLLSDIWRDLLGVLPGYCRAGVDFRIGNIPFSELRSIIPGLLEGIAEGSQRINNLAGNLKDYARMDSAGVNGQVDVHKVITTAVSLLGHQIRKRTCAFELNFGKELPLIRGSAQQLEQVVINLISNALEALPDRERGIRITTALDEERRCILIQVKDEGTGMARDAIDRVPEPFFTTKLAQGGTGLGLSISYSIVRDHRGALAIDSEPGRGTTVSITLPVD